MTVYWIFEDVDSLNHVAVCRWCQGGAAEPVEGHTDAVLDLSWNKLVRSVFCFFLMSWDLVHFMFFTVDLLFLSGMCWPVDQLITPLSCGICLKANQPQLCAGTLIRYSWGGGAKCKCDGHWVLGIPGPELTKLIHVPGSDVVFPPVWGTNSDLRIVWQVSD